MVQVPKPGVRYVVTQQSDNLTKISSCNLLVVALSTQGNKPKVQKVGD
jgi:hypothetical protein